MGTLYKNAILNNIVELGDACTPKVTPSKMCNDLGLSRSLVTKLKDNPDRTITGSTAQKIADYFGVSVDRVLGNGQKEKSPVPEGTELNQNYYMLSETNKAIVDSMIAQLLAAQSEN